MTQGDLAEMPPKFGFRYFLLLVDLFSLHMYAEPLKRKTGPAVQKAFKNILTNFHSPLIKLETDQVKYFFLLLN